jgi:hypothetical protein
MKIAQTDTLQCHSGALAASAPGIQTPLDSGFALCARAGMTTESPAEALD